MRADLAIIGFLALVVLGSVVRLVWAQRDTTVSLWTTGWAVLLVVAGLDLMLGDQGDRGGHPAHLFAMLFLSTSMPLLLLAAAMTWVGRDIPRWLVIGGLAVCGARAVIGVSGLVEVSLLVTSPIAASAAAAGGALIWLGRRKGSRWSSSVWLSLAYLAMAMVEIAMAWVHLEGKWIAEGRIVAAAVALTLAIAQITAVVSRMRERSGNEVRRRERDLRLLRSVARLGVSHERIEDLVEAVFELLVSDFNLQGVGLWLVDEESQGFEMLATRGLPAHFCRSFDRVDTSHPGIASILDLDEAVIVDRSDGHAPAEISLLADSGIEVAGFAKLRWQNRVLGVLVLAARDTDSLGDSPSELFGAVADELAMALNHVRAVEEQMRNARALASERRMLSAVLESAPIGILVEGPDHCIELLNATGVQHILCEGTPADWVGEKLVKLAAQVLPRIYDAEEKQRIVREATKRGRVIEDLEMVLHDPEERIVTIVVSPVLSSGGEWLGRVWLSRDITQERRLSEQLRHSQRLETIGTLSGGIAHDFNNQLAVILGNVRYALRQTAGDDENGAELRESLLDLERAADHCAGLTRSLLAFARREPVAIQSLDVERVMSELSDLLRPLFPSGIEIEIDVEEGLAPLAADPTQIQQVLLNLAINARDAIKDQGQLEIRVTGCEVDEDAARGVLGARPGRYIRIDVRDTGCGMDPESMTRIFEPFYTTKPVGEGTGLGLAIVHGVVSAHAGWLELESEPGEGSTFSVLLPVVECEVDAPSELSALIRRVLDE